MGMPSDYLLGKKEFAIKATSYCFGKLKKKKNIDIWILLLAVKICTGVATFWKLASLSVLGLKLFLVSWSC